MSIQKVDSVRLKFLVFLILGVSACFTTVGQKTKFSLHDTLDGRMDVSNFVANLNGFIPVPVIISEPAVGGFGGALALVFISPKRSAKKTEQFRFPDITAVAGMYTLNNSWATGALRQGSFPSIGMRYQAALAYADVNLNFYREITGRGEQEFLLNLKPLVISADISKNLYRHTVFLGLNYLFTLTKVSCDNKKVPDSLFHRADFDKNIGMPGLYAELDTRNSIFTPDHGIRVKTTYSFGRSWTGSETDMDKLDIYTNIFFQPTHWLVCGFRVAAKGISANAPFYYYPFLDMRGIPVMRYQGQQTFLIETEQRFDLNLRWSLVGFAGAGRTFSKSEFLADETWHYSGGAGFRYLIARLFRLRMGVDVAASPGQFAWYIVFGHYWNR